MKTFTFHVKYTESKEIILSYRAHMDQNTI